MEWGKYLIFPASVNPEIDFRNRESKRKWRRFFTSAILSLVQTYFSLVTAVPVSIRISERLSEVRLIDASVTES